MSAVGGEADIGLTRSRFTLFLLLGNNQSPLGDTSCHVISLASALRAPVNRRNRRKAGKGPSSWLAVSPDHSQLWVKQDALACLLARLTMRWGELLSEALNASVSDDVSS
jgi:hypothetical protein